LNEYFSRWERGFFWNYCAGSFLLSNLLYLAKYSLIDLNYLGNWITFPNSDIVLYTFLFVLSYIFGFSLRLIRPDYIEKVSTAIWITIRTIQFIPLSINWRHFQFNKKRFCELKVTWKTYGQSFPYIKWFIEDYVEVQPNNYRRFFYNLFHNQYSIPILNKNFHSFINFCKTFVFHNAPELKD
jgi:hypothetical protein